jgi:hypothetical protein
VGFVACPAFLFGMEIVTMKTLTETQKGQIIRRCNVAFYRRYGVHPMDVQIGEDKDGSLFARATHKLKNIDAIYFVQVEASYVIVRLAPPSAAERTKRLLRPATAARMKIQEAAALPEPAKQPKNKVAKNVLFNAMAKDAVDILERERIIQITDLEDQLADKYKERVKAFKDKLKSGRVEWRNLVDWIKARFTSADAIQYCQVGEHRLIVYCGACGSVDNRRLCYHQDARRTILELIKILER